MSTDSEATAPRSFKRARTGDNLPDPASGITHTSTSAAAPPGQSSTIDLFASFRTELDAHHDLNERLVRFSRDVTANSKKVIFLLHRYNPMLDVSAGAQPQRHSSNQSILDEAEAKLREITEVILKCADLELLGPVPASQPESIAAMQQTKRKPEGSELKAAGGGGSWKGKQKQTQTDDIMLPALSKAGRYSDRYDRAFGPGLEEYVRRGLDYRRGTFFLHTDPCHRRSPQIEAVSFLHFVQRRSLIRYDEVQSRFGDKIIIPPRRYLLGISDLSGELMRFATNAVGGGDVTGEACVNPVLATLRDIRDSLDRFTLLLGRDLVKKQAVTDQSVRKIEDSKSSISHSSRGLEANAMCPSHQSSMHCASERLR